MRLGPLEITRHRKAAENFVTQWPTAGTGWFPVIRESFAGAWQRGVTVDRTTVLTYSTVWACVTLIAGDIGKLRLKLVVEDKDGICTETKDPAYSPVLKKPNHFSTRVKFYEHWVLSKLISGNTFILKERDKRGVVTSLYVLDPSRTSVLVSPNGDVFYQLNTDYLSGIQESSVTVPAREIIHDICVPLYHPLCGVSPLHACGLAAMQGLKIQTQSAKMFGRGLTASGILVAPGTVSTEQAQKLTDYWEANYAGEENAGRVAVLGGGLKFEPMTQKAVDAQLIEQLKWTGEQVCACYHVPGYMVGIGPPPPYTDIQSINLQYYTQALQNPIENIETLLDEGLEMREPMHAEFDLKSLARMDQQRLYDLATKGVSGGIISVNEARAEIDRKPVEGGDQPMAQQQNWPLSQLAARDINAAPTDPDDAGDDSEEPDDTTRDQSQPEPVQATLNGAQVTALLEILNAVAMGQLPRDTGVQAIMVAFGVTHEVADDLMGEVGAGFEPKPLPGEEPASTDTPPQSDDEQEDEDGEEKSLECEMYEYALSGMVHRELFADSHRMAAR